MKIDTDNIKEVTLGEIGSTAARTPEFALKVIAKTLFFGIRALNSIATGVAKATEAAADSIERK